MNYMLYVEKIRGAAVNSLVIIYIYHFASYVGHYATENYSSSISFKVIIKLSVFLYACHHSVYLYKLELYVQYIE
jgi:hypothetical protein